MKVKIFSGLYAAFSLLILRANAAAIQTMVVAPEMCCVKVDTGCYDRSYVFGFTDDSGSDVVVKKMGVLRTNNVLYYSYEPTVIQPEVSYISYTPLDSPTGKFQGIPDFYVFDINQNENSIYLGGSDGIWVRQGPSLDFYSSEGKTISNIASMDYVYFTKENVPGIIKSKDGVFEVLLEDKMVKSFVLDKAENYTLVYLDDTGVLYAYRNYTEEHVKFADNAIFSGITVDLNGVVYAWYKDGIYKVYLSDELRQSGLIKISNIHVDAMTFDKSNNIIFSIGNLFYKLTKTNLAECSDL